MGEHTYYGDAANPTGFERNNALFSYPEFGDQLIIGKFCAIASGTKFILGPANHRLCSVATYPFQVFGGVRSGLPPPHLAQLPFRGDTVAGNDVWIGRDYHAGGKIGDGAIIAAYSAVAKDAPLYILKLSPLLCNGDLEKGKGELRRVIGGEGPLAGEERPMKKWYDEEYRFEIQVVGYLRGEKPQGYCRNGEEIGDIYTCTYGCPVNREGQGICSKTILLLFPLMEAVRSGGDLRNVGGEDKYAKTVVCPDGCVIFRLSAAPTGNENFSRGEFVQQ